MSEEARELLMEIVGGDTFKLACELDKLTSYRSGSGQIQREDVERLVDFEKLESIFRLQDLVGRREVKEALTVVDQLLLWNEKPTRILASLGSFYLTLLRLKREQRRKASEELSTKFGLSSFYIQNCMPHVRRFSERQLVSALELTHQKELEMKEGAVCVKPLLSTYVHQLCSL